MIVLDANILLYAYDEESELHREARDYLLRIFSGLEPVGIPMLSLSAFLRILSQRGTGSARFSLRELVEIADEWFQWNHVQLLTPGERHWILLQRMLLEGNAPGRRVTDAQIAALTIEYGGILQTNDRDFGRYPGLRWENPLVLG